MRVQRTRVLLPAVVRRSPLTRSPLGGLGVLLAVGLLLAMGCTGKSASATSSTPVVKVYIQADGTILADGKPVSLDELKRIFVDLKAKHGAVTYDRAGGEDSPAPPHAMEVIGAIAEAQLPTLIEGQPDARIEFQEKK